MYLAQGEPSHFLVWQGGQASIQCYHFLYVTGLSGQCHCSSCAHHMLPLAWSCLFLALLYSPAGEMKFLWSTLIPPGSLKCREAPGCGRQVVVALLTHLAKSSQAKSPCWGICLDHCLQYGGWKGRRIYLVDLVGFGQSKVDWDCVFGIRVVEGICKLLPCCMGCVCRELCLCRGFQSMALPEICAVVMCWHPDQNIW